MADELTPDSTGPNTETLPPQYDPKAVESRLYDAWLKEAIFEANSASSKPKYTLILPPPNVTGVLHMGHALTCTLEDILVRRKRMQGFEALWVPGTDHAGIATQMVVERNLLAEEKKSRHDLGREKFLEKVWAWKEKSQNTILSQLRLMGCSLDWSRLAFTLDENVSRAVRECFVRLFREKLLYRSDAIIQWCPRCRTALSDLEVKFKEKPGKLWHIRYLHADDPTQFLIVATTRPETLLGDTAVAVHPLDTTEGERFAAFLGKKVRVPLVNRAVPVIADEYVDREFGTGALKITPAHDPNDYLVGKRHELPSLSILDESATLNDQAGPYAGLTREKAREKILADLLEQGLLEKEVDHTHSVGHCDRCGTVVEPRLSAQWFVNAEVLAQPAIEAVEKGDIKIVPEEWEKTYFEWMRNIRPWCVSRQLWWGHRIPVWYCGDCHGMTCEVLDPTKCTHCGSPKLRQDEDVLDTWFSSGLWPISTLGWPDESEDLKAFYPTDVLETGFDILFFWVARMIMLGMKMTGKIPFHTVYLHPMVRDEYGQKMSKTKGNVVDPLEIIKHMGADSLRYFFAANAFHGRDVRVSDAQLEGCRNFVNKIWNASRFVLMHFGDQTESNPDRESPVNRWILASLNETKREVNRALDSYRFFDAANLLYHFLWDKYCFWFIEFIKDPNELARRKAIGDTVAVEVLEQVLRLLHPIMPFLTEELWTRMPIRTGEISISVAAYPEARDEDDFPEELAQIERVCRVIEKVRTTRGVFNLPPAQELSELVVVPVAGASRTGLESFGSLICKLARAKTLRFADGEPPREAFVAQILSDVKVFIPRAELGDVSQEKARKEKELRDKKSALERADVALANPKFTTSAPEAVIEGRRRQREDLAREVEALEHYLKDLSV